MGTVCPVVDAAVLTINPVLCPLGLLQLLTYISLAAGWRIRGVTDQLINSNPTDCCKCLTPA